MRKLTAGIFTILLGVVSVGAANAEIASKTYVDAQKTAVEAGVATAIAGKADKADTLAGYGITDAMTTTDINTALGTKANTADLGTLATKDTIVTADITDANVTKAKLAADVATSLGKADTALQEASLTDYAKTVDVNTSLGLKADKATTLAGYGITDAMTTTAINTALGDKANTADLGTLATKDTIVTADITDANVTKAKLAADVATSLGKADTALQEASLTDYAKTVDVNTSLGLKADKTAIADMETKTSAATTYAVKSTETVASGAAAAAAAAQTAVDELDAVVGSELTGLAATKKIADDAATAAAANTSAIAGKADKATTLAGYGITDAMTAGAINTALGAKADTADLGTLATAAPGACSNPTSKCVLTFNGTDYSWEVVER